MAYNFDEICPKCGKKFHVQEFPTGVPGGKEKDDIDCPWCYTTVYRKTTDGYFRTSKITE